MDANFGYPVDGEVAPCAASAETEIEKDLYDQICKILGKEGININKSAVCHRSGHSTIDSERPVVRKLCPFQ